MADWGSDSIQKQLFQRCAPPIIEGARSQGRNEAEGTPERRTDNYAEALRQLWVCARLGWVGGQSSQFLCLPQ